MSKYKINQNDKCRVLLSELLPYEVPILFSNEGFYSYFKEYGKNHQPALITKILNFENNEYRIAYSFDIKRGIEGKRTLSLIHPAIQIKFIEFYQKYDALIIHQCNKSPISLRYPYKIATHFYFKNLIVPEQEEVNINTKQNESDKDYIYSSYYFSYKKYNFLYKFYDSYEFLRLEKKFKHLLRFDIAKCFDSIYTHTISWAVKDKTYAKENINKKSFESDFDKLMCASNYNETNGILIGSEVSRIFAEIILQRIDLNAIEKLKNSNLHLGVDYAVRRYVDDYFVFTKEKNLGIEILKVFQSELAKFKLHINDSKTEEIKTPFITGITIARTELKRMFESFFDTYIKFEEIKDIDDDSVINMALNLTALKKSLNIANWVIRDIKSIVKKYNIEYDSITGVSFSIFKGHISKIYQTLDPNHLNVIDKEYLAKFLIVIFDILFFIYSMDYRVRSTYTMSQIIISTVNFITKCDPETKHSVSKKIFDESIYLLKIIENDDNYNNIELLNLLISLKKLGDDYLLPIDTLNSLLKMDKDEEQISYFHSMIILYYIQEKPQYITIKQKIENNIILKFTNELKPFQKAELTCLFFDTLSCPYISRLTKENLTEISFKKIDNIKPEINIRNEIINYVSRRSWFINWDQDIELGSLLFKKELRTPY